MDKPYVSASRIAFFRSFVRFRKKLTVIGIIGHTQGVSKAINPPRNPAKKMNSQEVSVAVTVVSPKAFNSSITGVHKAASFVNALVIFSGLTITFSSFANENRLLLFGIWLAGILHIICKNERKASDVACMTAAGLFSAAALLPFAGIKVFSDCGLHIADITVRLEQVPRIEEMQAANWFAMCWWIAALLFTCILIWKVSKHNVVLMLVWLGGIASEAIMHFSPTIYASGARVYYLTDWMCMFIILVLAFKMPGKKWRDLYYSIVAGLGVWNLLYQVINYI